MSKYIDADRLKAEIEMLYEIAKDNWIFYEESKGEMTAYNKILSFIDFPQQEQLVNKDLGTLIACDIIEMTAKKAIDKPQDKEKEEELMTRKINYLRLLEENYVQQEQSKNLEEAAEKYADSMGLKGFDKVRTISDFKAGAEWKQQPTVDLEKEVKSYIKDNFTITDEVAQIPEEDRRYSMWEDDMVAFARHFWNKWYNARKEE